MYFILFVVLALVIGYATVVTLRFKTTATTRTVRKIAPVVGGLLAALLTKLHYQMSDASLSSGDDGFVIALMVIYSLTILVGEYCGFCAPPPAPSS